MTETMPTSEVLYRAADLIEERGWTQGGDGWAFRNDTSPVCLEGGLIAALGLSITDDDFNEFYDCPSYVAVEDYLADDLHGCELWDWNDRPTRSASEVIEVLRACAVIEASREREVAEVSPEAVSA